MRFEYYINVNDAKIGFLLPRDSDWLISYYLKVSNWKPSKITRLSSKVNPAK